MSQSADGKSIFRDVLFFVVGVGLGYVTLFVF